MNLNRIFTSHMVFAAKKPIRIYGEGSGKVTINFAGQEKMGVFSCDNWMMEFEAMEYGGPYSMKVIFEDRNILLEDIYIGEVYLFSGQSNMELKLEDTNTSYELYKSNDKLRFYSTDRITNSGYYKADDGWIACDKEKAGKLSALAYLTGIEVSERKCIAVGIIQCFQSASVIESWVPEGSFQKIGIDISENYKFGDHAVKKYSAWNKEGALYSFALSQVIPYALSGVVWYQGESDTSEVEGNVYCDELCELIKTWRKDFRDNDLPFVVIQIADFIEKRDMGWSLVQRAQLDVQSKISGVKTVISCDVCENDDVHPKTKDKLAKRIINTLLG